MNIAARTPTDFAACWDQRPRSLGSWPRVGLVVALIVGPTAAVRLPAAEPIAAARYGPARHLCDLAEPSIRESSGLAISYRHPGLFWTHNDSGDEPRLFAFDEQGRHRGTCHLSGAMARDWEDMGSFQWRGQDLLFVGDVGDNLGQRSSCQVYLFAEPPSPDGEARVLQTLEFSYEDGPRDCEALALDGSRREFLLVEKRLSLSSAVYRLPWTAGPAGERRLAQRIATIPLPWATSMDISSDGRRAIVATYGSAYEFSRQPEESWQTALARAGRMIELPHRTQGETICYGPDGVSLFLTSEQRPCPLFVLSPANPGSP